MCLCICVYYVACVYVCVCVSVCVTCNGFCVLCEYVPGVYVYSLVYSGDQISFLSSSSLVDKITFFLFVCFLRLVSL